MSTSIGSEKSEVDRIVKANNTKGRKRKREKEKENGNAVSSKKASAHIS